MKDFGFRLGLQLGFPVDKTYKKNRFFHAALQKLQEEGFYGVELNLIDYDEIDPEELQKFLGEYDLRMTMVATGTFAKQESLSLSDEDEDNRKKSVDKLLKILQFAEEAKAGVICGFLKGAGSRDYGIACG